MLLPIPSHRTLHPQPPTMPPPPFHSTTLLSCPLHSFPLPGSVHRICRRRFSRALDGQIGPPSPPAMPTSASAIASAPRTPGQPDLVALVAASGRHQQHARWPRARAAHGGARERASAAQGRTTATSTRRTATTTMTSTTFSLLPPASSSLHEFVLPDLLRPRPQAAFSSPIQDSSSFTLFKPMDTPVVAASGF
uniref:Uncharacterized protein n=1 Tax=Leersia perrieri TaxID=77586 RepID=A0A0D9WDX1_9ORYZ